MTVLHVWKTVHLTAVLVDFYLPCKISFKHYYLQHYEDLQMLCFAIIWLRCFTGNKLPHGCLSEGRNKDRLRHIRWSVYDLLSKVFVIYIKTCCPITKNLVSIRKTCDMNQTHMIQQKILKVG